MKNQVAMRIDLERCIGCKTCQSACKVENGIGAGRYRVMNVEVKPSRNQRLYFMTLPCMQCEKPACAASCPTNAIYKREKDGVVLIDKAKCIGCQYCLHACPYGAINFDKDNNVADKCTYCAHKLDRGEQPACVSKCPGFSLDLKRKEDLVKETGLEGRKVKDTDRFRTNPSTFYVERLKP